MKEFFLLSAFVMAFTLNAFSQTGQQDQNKTGKNVQLKKQAQNSAVQQSTPVKKEEGNGNSVPEATAKPQNQAAKDPEKTGTVTK